MKSIEYWDESQSISFSTYACETIKNNLTRTIEDLDNNIRRPANIESLKRKYFYYIDQYIKANLPIPNDEKIMEDLNISRKTLDKLKTDYKLNTQSLSTPLDSEGSENTLEDTIYDKKESYNTLLENIANKELLAFLKKNLSHYEYFIIYYKFFYQSSYNTRTLSKILKVHPWTIQNNLKKVLSKIKKYINLSDVHEIIYTIDKKTKKLIDSDNFNYNPIIPDHIIKFLYIKDSLTRAEIAIYKIKYLSDLKYSTKFIAKILNLQIEKVQKIENNLNKKIETLCQNKEQYKEFYNNVMEHFKQDIFDVDLNIDISKFKINLKRTQEYWNLHSYEELISYTHESSISDDLKENIKKYFGVIDTEMTSKSKLEYKINRILNNYYVESEVTKKDLFESYRKNKANLTDYQKFQFDFFFKKFNLEKFRAIFPNSNLNKLTTGLYEQVYSLHFNITNYNHIKINKTTYKRIKSSCSNIPKDIIKTLDYYYTLSDIPKTSKMAEFLNIQESQVSAKIQEAKNIIINCYLGRQNTLKLDLDIYRDYLTKTKLDFSEPTKSMLRMFLFENKSYEEISELLNMSLHDVSKLVVSAIWRIDYSRFKIFDDFPFSNEFLLQVLNNEPIFDDSIKNILKIYINERDSSFIESTYGVDKKKLDILMTKLYNKCRDLKISTQNVEDIDIIREINVLPTENVLSEKEIIVLSLLYGIKNNYNVDGKKYRVTDISKLTNLESHKIQYYKKSALTSIKAKKAGILKASYDFINKYELMNLLNDPHIPLKDKAKTLLKSIYGIGVPNKTLNEISIETNEKIRTLKLRLYKAIVTIKRYQNGEIEGTTSYELDVLPYFKYFTLHDRKILEDFYKNHMTYEELMKKFNYTYAEILYIMLRLRFYLKEIKLDYPPCIDFDKYYENIDKDDIPFYGNINFAKELFELYYEKQINIVDITKMYGGKYTEFCIKKNIVHLIIAVMKRSIGIKKKEHFTYDEFKNYYLAHQSEMSTKVKKNFYNYFKSIETNTAYSRSLVTNKMYDLLIQESSSFIHLEDFNKDEMINFLKKYQFRLTKNELNTIYKRFDIHPRLFMNGKDQRKVLNFLANVQNSNDKSLNYLPNKTKI